MKLENIIKNKESAYLYMERYVNNGSPSGFDRKNTSSSFTSPRGRARNYELLVIEFDNDIMVRTIGEETNIISDRCVFCHPDNLKEEIFQELSGRFKVVGTVTVAPTASPRTVKLIGYDYFIKLDYVGYLGRIKRNLDFQHILSAFEVTRDISEGIDQGLYNERFGVLKENKGRVAYLPKKDGGYYEFGYLIREFVPHYRGERKDLFLIPAFSLFAHDTYAPKYKPLLFQILEKNNKEINEFAFNDVLGPILDCYFDALVNHGLAMESHAQNTLIAINRDYEIKLIVSRDMESVDKDLPLREYLGVNNEILAKDYKCIRSSDYNYTIKHSFMFDFKLGEYLLTPLIKLFSTDESFDVNEIIKKMKAKSRLYISRLPESYFPEEWFNYENKQFKAGEKRPYISNPNPKYR